MVLKSDSQLEIIQQTITLQKNALEIVKVQKSASVVTELAVKKFEAEVLNSQSREFEVFQRIKETENELNFLLGRYPQPIVRDKADFTAQLPPQIRAGIPSQLLANRPDIKQAELELYATQCDVKTARAEFYPSFDITGGLGFRAFKPSYLFTAPESMMYSLLGELVAPLINRSAIKAEFNKAKAYQVQALYEYQKKVLETYVEVNNQISNIDALDSKLELIEARKKQFYAVTNIYKALGGGWK